MSNSIQLPESLPEFKEKTLIVCMTHSSALFYLGEGNMITGPEPFETDAVQFEYSDKEGFQYGRGRGQGTAPGTDNHNKEHYERVFLNIFSKEIEARFQRKSFTRMVVFVPEDIKNITAEKLPASVMAITDIRTGIVTKEHPLQLAERLHR